MFPSSFHPALMPFFQKKIIFQKPFLIFKNHFCILKVISAFQNQTVKNCLFQSLSFNWITWNKPYHFMTIQANKYWRAKPRNKPHITQPQTPKLKPQISSPKPQISNPKPQISNPKSQPREKPQTPNPRPQTPNPRFFWTNQPREKKFQEGTLMSY